jgi:hypothetical protein
MPNHQKKSEKLHLTMGNKTKKPISFCRICAEILSFPAGCAPSKRIVVTAVVWSELDRVNLGSREKDQQKQHLPGILKGQTSQFLGFLDVTDVTNWHFLGFQK